MQAIIAAGFAEERDYLSFVLRHTGRAVALTAKAEHLPSVLAWIQAIRMRVGGSLGRRVRRGRVQALGIDRAPKKEWPGC